MAITVITCIGLIVSTQSMHDDWLWIVAIWTILYYCSKTNPWNRLEYILYIWAEKYLLLMVLKVGLKSSSFNQNLASTPRRQEWLFYLGNGLILMCIGITWIHIRNEKFLDFHPRATKSESVDIELYANKFRWPLVYNEALKLFEN